MAERASSILQNAIEQGLTICLDTNCLIFYFGGEQPWTEKLRPVFEAKDNGKIRLVTSTVTLAEVLAKAQNQNEHDQLLNAVQRYFEVMPVSHNAGLYAAGIRQQHKSIKTPDALEMATASETGAVLFITNDEQLVDKSLGKCDALYLKKLAVEWIEAEFQTCIDTSEPVVTLAKGATTLHLDVDLSISAKQPLPLLQTPLPANDFPLLALKLSQLVAGSAAVIGLIEGIPGGEERIIALRILPTGRPWLAPGIPDWVKQFTNKTHHWHEPEPETLLRRVQERIESFNRSNADKDKPERQTLFLLADISLADAEIAIASMDGNGQMLPHRKLIETWRYYLAPFRPLRDLWTIERVRLWRGEAGNAHHLDVAHFRDFFASANNVLGERSTK